MARATGSTALPERLAPPSERVSRFALELEQLWPEVLSGKPPPRLGIAVSGGPDSCALLLLAAAALPGRVEAATVDHQLRPESGEEAQFVAQLCARLAVPHRICAVEVQPGNLQSRAREARYAALADWAEERGLHAVATAHHADDQAETMILRLNRASGVSGLAGARARGSVPGTRLALLRPLLGWRRSELADLLDTIGVAAVQDPSNLDDRFDRIRLRKAMAGSSFLDISATAQSASHLADAADALEWAALREWEESVCRKGPDLVYQPKAPRAIALRVIARIVSELDGAAPRGGVAGNVFAQLAAGRPASIGNLVARPGPDGWRFSKGPARRHS